jgi:TonB family protein
VEFIIAKDGSVTNVVAKRKVDGGCTEEALRVIKKMPNWTPGRQEGKPVNVKYTLPIKFKLQDNYTTSTNTTASFIGGEVALSEYLANNLKYPKKARKKKIEGTVVVNFVVTINGKIQGATITQSLNKDCDTEALRLVNAMPKWTPATKNGIPAMSTHSLPIKFKL